MPSPNSAELQEILRDTRTVAVVGASDNPARPSYDVYQYLTRFSHFSPAAFQTRTECTPSSA